MLQIVNDFKAVKSPCHVCNKLGKDGYTDCASFCTDVNQYLLRLGDFPNAPPTEKDLHLKFPPKLTGYALDLVTEEETYQACSFLIEYKSQNNRKSGAIAAEIGISVEYFNTCLRRGVKRLGRPYYDRIMAFKERQLVDQ